MAIPAILLAIALVSLWGGGLLTVIVAIAIPEIPRVVAPGALDRAVDPRGALRRGRDRGRHADAADPAPPRAAEHDRAADRAGHLHLRLGDPDRGDPVSFLGAGIPPEIPTWGNIMAEGRVLFQVFPHNILFPGIFLALTVLAVNMLGDGLRDTLDPRMAKRI